MKLQVDPKQSQQRTDDTPARQRIVEAAFAAFSESGYSGVSTLEIATRAQVSKRDLYALVGNKAELLAACVAARAKRFETPTELAVPDSRDALVGTLVALGTRLLREISDPAVIAVFRLAIAEAVRAPEVARILDSVGRKVSRSALQSFMKRARDAGLVHGRPDELVEQFWGLLWGRLMVDLLLGVADRPTSQAMARRARDAAEAFVRLHLGSGDCPPLPRGRE